MQSALITSNAFRLGTRLTLALTTSRNSAQRTFVSSCRVLRSSPLDKHQTTPKITRTKKPFSELPSSYLSPDGTPTALEPWSGGLRLVEPSQVLLPSNNDIKKKSRRKKAISDAPSQPGLYLASEITDGSVTRPKRGRRPKVALNTSEDSIHQDSSDGTSSALSPPSNQLAVEILQNLKNFPNSILLTRVGQFYESYFEQAAQVARLLNIKLTRRTWDKQQVLMCGFPLMHFDRHLKTLVEQHKLSVALCEEFPRHVGSLRAGFERRVVRVITPGTLIDEAFINPYENNYALSIAQQGGTAPTVGLAWMDVSTGEFFSKSVPSNELYDEVVRISPREVILDESLRGYTEHPIRRVLLEANRLVSYSDRPEVAHLTMSLVPVTEHGQQISDDLIADVQKPSEGTVYTDEETCAINLLMHFLKAHLMDSMPSGLAPYREKALNRMQIDAHTIKALEIREGLREGSAVGSLINVLKKTLTSGGTRLLSRWLCSPSASLAEITARQNVVSFFYMRVHLQEDVLHYLKEVDDAVRIVQRFMVGRGDVADLWSIANTISIWEKIRLRIQMEKLSETKELTNSTLSEQWASVDALLAKINDMSRVSTRLLASLAQRGQTGPIFPVDGAEAEGDDGEGQQTWVYQRDPSLKWSITPQYSEELLNLHTKLRDLTTERDELEHRFQVEYEALSLTLRSSPQHGFHVHIGKSKRDVRKINQDPAFVAVSESGSTKIYFNREWYHLGAMIVDIGMKIQSAEKEAFDILKNEVNARAVDVRQNARVVDELDVVISFAALARERNFVRPLLTEGTDHHVIAGRHPTVEYALLTSGRVFTPNTTNLSSNTTINLITGANMSGKSCFLRQSALITVLAQVGSFVPASHAELGIIDRLFSRIGAGDDLFRDRSTFMVEMVETADILKRATNRSLVIMDEIGRGTTVRDGLAIAYATLHHLCTVNKCKTLFATHFHELADMMGYIPSTGKGSGVFESVEFLCTAVDNTEDGHFTYSHRMRSGVSRDSHGLKVAQLAGMPSAAMNVAQEALARIRHTESTTDLKFVWTEV